MKKLVLIMAFLSLAITLAAGCAATNKQPTSLSAKETVTRTTTSAALISGQTADLNSPGVYYDKTFDRCGGYTGGSLAQSSLITIPGGQFEMGDHFGFVDPQHPTDEIRSTRLQSARFIWTNLILPFNNIAIF